MSRAERRWRTRLVVARRRKVLEQSGLLDHLCPELWLPDVGMIYSSVVHFPAWNRKQEDFETYRSRRIAFLYGRCRRMAPLDCGRPHCGVCAGGKRWMMGRTRRELQNDDRYYEQMEEL